MNLTPIHMLYISPHSVKDHINLIYTYSITIKIRFLNTALSPYIVSLYWLVISTNFETFLKSLYIFNCYVTWLWEVVNIMWNSCVSLKGIPKGILRVIKVWHWDILHTESYFPYFKKSCLGCLRTKVKEKKKFVYFCIQNIYFICQTVHTSTSALRLVTY